MGTTPWSSYSSQAHRKHSNKASLGREISFSVPCHLDRGGSRLFRQRICQEPPEDAMHGEQPLTAGTNAVPPECTDLGRGAPELSRSMVHELRQKMTMMRWVLKIMLLPSHAEQFLVRRWPLRRWRCCAWPREPLTCSSPLVFSPPFHRSLRLIGVLDVVCRSNTLVGVH